jgi:phosphoglycerate kinase
MELKDLQKINVKGKKILLRVDFNAPIKNGKILDFSRIKQSLFTLKYLIRKNAKIILVSHLDDPKKRNKKYSLKPIANYLKKIGFKVKFLNDFRNKKAFKKIEKIKKGEIIFLENIRFYKEEKENNLNFAKELASLADLYVNEAFSVSHRKHASVFAITKFLKSYPGFNFKKEIENLSKFLFQLTHPLVVLIGGLKISTKINLIKKLAKKADKVLIAGALANNFFVAKGINVGSSIYEKEMVKKAKTLLKEKKLVLPIDVKIERFKKVKNVDLFDLNKIKDKNFRILDIGFKTTDLFSNYLKSAKMIIWNGPVGFFEDKRFSLGTKKLAKVIFNNKKAKVLIGGGETLASIKNLKKKKNIFISTGGGAMLKFLEEGNLISLKPLLK